MTMNTITSREFGQNVSSAKHRANEGPLFITDRGKPAYVLLTIEDFNGYAGQRSMTLLELMDNMPNTGEVPDFEITPAAIELRQED